MLILPLSMLILLTQPPRSLGAEMKTYSQRAAASTCTLVMCSPVENGLPGRDGRDGREGPRGEKGDPGTAPYSSAPPRFLPRRIQQERPSRSTHLPPNKTTHSPVALKDTAPLPTSLTSPPSTPATLTPLELFPNGRAVGEKIFKTGGFEKTFEDAQQVCMQAGGQMASPRSAAENEALQQLATAQNKAAFLSMTDIKTEGKFTYPTGEPLVYSNWAPGEPNDNGGSEDCVEIFTNGKWNDKNCREQRLVVSRARCCHNPSLTLFLVELFPNGRAVGEKIFKTGGFEKTFEDAQQVCMQAGGQMASPRSAAENEALQQLATAQNKAAFLSMTDIKTEGKFTYPTGEPLVYSNWAPGEPNDNGGSEDCVEIFTNGKWNDKNCREQRLVVCEF
ncbi:pulmonary surfactant-associated protein D [Ailuropoda melanoleuca]|uniref:pulmonary surfactant-associated protein D n=1 Tax=Ailuropoda melanoleuca TaxID=9646 RepID=UPI001493F864|nr:pulmonary surfactant-associated protein D [Ailuropoda melanoleuca]